MPCHHCYSGVGGRWSGVGVRPISAVLLLGQWSNAWCDAMQIVYTKWSNTYYPKYHPL